MKPILVNDTTKASHFLQRIEKEINELKDTYGVQRELRLFEESVGKDVRSYLDMLVDRGSLLTRDSNQNMSVKIGHSYIKLQGYSWAGAYTFEYPFINETAKFREVMRADQVTFKTPELLRILLRYYGDERKTAKVLLLNFPSFKKVAQITCTIPKITAGNWHRSQILVGVDREKIREMEQELDNVLSLLLL